MASVVDKRDFSKPVIRRKALSASNEGSLATVVNFGDLGELTFDEPVAHGGSDKGPTPLTGVLASLCACEAVTFGRTAREMGFEYEGIEFDAAFTIDIRGRSGMRGSCLTSRRSRSRRACAPKIVKRGGRTSSRKRRRGARSST